MPILQNTIFNIPSVQTVNTKKNTQNNIKMEKNTQWEETSPFSATV
jgi:hypothetical protein